MHGFGVILIDDVNLDTWILRINLALDEALEGFRYVDIKTNLSTRGNNLETEMFLGGARLTQKFSIFQNTMKRGKHLLGGKFLFVVIFWNFQHQKYRLKIQGL